jgi:hypothetical protein
VEVRIVEAASPVAVRFANAASALAVTKQGPMGGAPTKPEVEETSVETLYDKSIINIGRI